MSREIQLAKNTAIIGIGTFLPKLVALVTLPIVTGYLSKTDYGTYDLIVVLISLILPVATLQIQSAAFRFLIQVKTDFKKSASVISSIFFFTISMSLIPILIIGIFIKNYSIFIRIVICLYFLFDILLRTFQQSIRGLGKNLLYSISTIIMAIINMIGLIIFVQCKGWGLVGVILSIDIANMIAIIYLLLFGDIIKYIHFDSVSKTELKKLLAYSWPMVPNNLSSWIMTLSDRLLLVFFWGVEVNAVYAIAKKIPNLIATVQSTFSLAWQENASLSVNDDDINEYYSKMFDVIFDLIVGATALLVGSASILFYILIRGNYGESYQLMPILFLAMMFSALASFMAGIYIAEKRTKEIGVTTTIAALINIAIDLIAMPKIGIWAACISTLVSYIYLFFFRVYDIRRFKHLQYKKFKNFTCIIVIFIFCCCSALNQKILNIILFFVSILFFAVLNRTLLNNILMHFKSKETRF